MEAEHSRPSDGERSGGQQQSLSESSNRGRFAQTQEPITSLPLHGSHGRHHRRQPKRRDLLQRQQQQQSQLGEAWQLQDVPGPSGGSYTSSSIESSTPGPHLQRIPSCSSQELQEGTASRKERKPQKPGKYVCSYCGRPCAKPSVLQKHIRSHTGERPYPCVPCSFSFKTKSNLYKHRKSHAHRIKAGLASRCEESSFSGVESGAVGDEQEEATEADSTESEDETGLHQPSTSQERPALRKSSKFEISFSEEGPRTEDSQAIKQRLAMRLSERKRAPVESPDESPSSSLGPGSKGSTESGYFSSYGSAELSQVSPPNANVKSYAEIILGKYGRLGQQQRIPHQHLQPPLSSSSSLGHEEKSIHFSVPKTQVIEHITKLITINEAVVDTSEIDSVKPRRSSLSRRSSIESAKFSSPKDPKEDYPGISGATGQTIPSSYATDIQHSQLCEGTLTSHCPSGVLLRSQSVPSSSVKDDSSSSSSHSFRLSQSFDEQQAASVELRVGHHHRMLRRQPAIEMPVGADLAAEAGSSLSTQSGWKQQKGTGLYECEICGTQWRKQDSYEAHRVSCMGKVSQSEKKVAAEQEDHRQIMHYKFKAMAMAIRKRRKEESLEEDPPSPGPAAVSFSTHLATSAITSKDDFQGLSGSVPQTEPEKIGPYKEISVIQHTSSFEKQESMSIEISEPELEHKESQEPKQPSTSRLVRQPKIQVPEILVTKEPDTEMVSPPASIYIPKELEKEEFQWPQRSQSLAQLPAEKLPPKKKRLRLAETPQSSGESSFESLSLPRSPSQESNISHTSSRSTSFDETGKVDSEMQSGTWSSQGSHMLTVPGVYQHYHREMHRSVSEQAPSSPPHPAQIVETRSKSFDCGSLSSRQASSSWKERRKCLLVKHATLEKQDQEESSSSVHQSILGHAVDEHRESSTSRLSPESLGKTLQLFQTPLTTTVYPYVSPEALSSQQIAGLLPVTTISEVLSNHMLQQTLIQTVPSSFHPRQLNLAEHLGLPVQSFPNLLSLQYPTSSLIIQGPMPSPIDESSSSASSAHKRGSPFQHLVTRHQPRPIIATCLEQLTPVVSLVVPVRLQTHIPTYASAMYTTISQILATTRSQQPICCTAMVIMEKLEGTKLQRSFLRLPTPTLKTCIPLSLPLEFPTEAASGDGCGPLCAGGSKRMLSPAGSLELSLEAQRQQKRIKEEEEEEVEESGDECKTCDQGINKEGQSDRKGVEVVLEKEPEKEEKKTKFVGNMQEISQVESRLKKEEMQEEAHRCVSVVEIPERSTGSTDPLYPSLHTSTSVSWCYLNYTKPNPSPHTNPQTSVYSSWSVSMYNPNLPGLSTKIVLSLLCSKQMHSSGVYTTATTPSLTTDNLVDKQTPRVSEVHGKTSSTPDEEKEEPPNKMVEKEVRSKEKTASTSKHSEPLRVCIFEGGYKSNEEYIYVRGRGRGKYVCGECGIRCKKPSMLKKHIRTHTDIRPYVCKHCNFAFKTKGNLTKHMKSKAHGKKCLEKGVSESSVDEVETEEPGASEGQVYESEDQDEHQFSDNEDSEDEDDEDNEEEEDESSHDDAPSSCSTDTHQSDSGPGSQSGPTSLSVSEREEREKQLSPVQPWKGENKRALFSSKAWEHSPRAFSSASEGSPLRSVSPRLELSSPCRHLSPSPERGPSPLTASPLRSFSPLRPLSPARYRSSRARISPTAFRTQHRAHSSPGHFHWEPSTKSRESQQERTSTPSKAQASQRLSSPHASLVPSALHFTHTDPPVHAPNPSRTIDRMFSHLPLHSQQQARMPYHMIPIGGIQMVQLRPRSCPKLERASSSTQSPSSPKEEFTFSLSKSSWSTLRNLQSEPSQSVSGTQGLERETRPLGLYCPVTSSTTAKSSPPYDKEKTKDREQYGSSWPSKTRTSVPKTSQEGGQDTIEWDKRSSDGSENESRVSLHRKGEQSEPEVPKEGQSKNDPSSKESEEEKCVYSDQSQDSTPDST